MNAQKNTSFSPKFVISEDLSKSGGYNISINDTEINDEVFNQELVNYRYVDRFDLISDIQDFLYEARRARRLSDAAMMDDDIDYLKTLPDNYVFTSISTNEYIAFSQEPQKFDDICQDILEAHNKL
jgi:hypothetical protein